MKRHLHYIGLAIISALSYLGLEAQDSQKTQVVIIGVIHSESANRNTNILLDILQQIKPDVLLAETDTLSGYFKSDLSLVEPPNWYKAANKMGLAKKMPPEMDILYKYRNIKADILIYPFDLPIKNRRRYVSDQNKFEQDLVSAINRASDYNEIPAAFSQQHNTFIVYNNYLHSIYEKSYQEMNQPQVRDSIRAMMQLEYNYLPTLMDSVARLKKYKEKFMIQQTSWQHRNEVMAQNIIHYVQKHRGKKIVVLTGLLHKYILNDLLLPQENIYQFKLTEYYK